MSLLQEAIQTAAQSNQPQLIGWAYHHPQANKANKVASLSNPNCPDEVINDGYTQPVGIRLAALTGARSTDQYNAALAKETSVQILRRLIDNGHVRADEALAARDDETVRDLAVKATHFCLANDYVERMPRLFWKYSPPHQWRTLHLHQQIDRLTSGECTDEQIQVLTFDVMKTLHSRLDCSSFRPTIEQCETMNTIIGTHRDLLAATDTYDELLTLQRTVNRTILPNLQDQTEPQSALTAYPSIATYPWRTDVAIKNADLEDQGWSIDGVLAELVDKHDYVGAGNCLMNVSNSIRSFRQWRATYDRDLRREIIRGWLGWALQSTEVADEDIASFIWWVVGDATNYDLLRDIRTPRLDTVMYEHFSTYDAFQVLGADTRLDYVRGLNDGLTLISMMCAEADPTVVAAADQLAEGWEGTLNELFTAARLATC